MLASRRIVLTLASHRFSFVLVCHSYPPVIGGSEIEAQRVCAALAAQGHSAQVLCCAGGPMPPGQWEDAYGTLVECFGGAGRLGVYAYVLGVLWRLWRKRQKHQIVYFLMPGLQVCLGVPWAALLGKKVIMKFSGSNEVRKLLDSPVGRLELRLLAQHASRILLLNPGMFREAAEAGLPKSLLSWMPNPVDMQAFAPANPADKLALRREMGLEPEAWITLYVGRLAPEKQLPVLLEAFARVAAESRTAHLVLAGDGPERNALTQKAVALGLDKRVSWVGACPPERVPRWLRVSDAFALLSALEGFPVALLEAMAAALPAVASDIPANRQLIEDTQTGLLVPPGDVPAAAEALLRLLKTPETSRHMGAQARASVADKYSTERIAARYEALFTEIC